MVEVAKAMMSACVCERVRGLLHFVVGHTFGCVPACNTVVTWGGAVEGRAGKHEEHALLTQGA
eukprot:583600-Pelagomonas_calceolata.AAC.5